MHSGCYTAQDIQDKADIVSAFCIIMGLEISVSKLRRFVWAVTGKSAQPCAEMIIRGLNWVPTTIPVEQDGCLTYLGGLYDVKKRDKTALAEITEIARTHCAEVMATRASAITKLACANMTQSAEAEERQRITCATVEKEAH